MYLIFLNFHTNKVQKIYKFFSLYLRNSCLFGKFPSDQSDFKKVYVNYIFCVRRYVVQSKNIEIISEILIWN